MSVKVTRVVDGDTVRVSRTGWLTWFFPGDIIVVRLYAIDAPESQQRYGKESTAALRRYLKGRGKLMMEVQDTDRYGRTVGLLYRAGVGREKSANWRMVENGWAYAYTRYGGSELGMQQAEREAKKRRIGVWASKTNREGRDRPWDYRAGARLQERRRVKIRMVLATLAAAGLLAVGLWSWYRDW